MVSINNVSKKGKWTSSKFNEWSISEVRKETPICWNVFWQRKCLYFYDNFLRKLDSFSYNNRDFSVRKLMRHVQSVLPLYFEIAINVKEVTKNFRLELFLQPKTVLMAFLTYSQSSKFDNVFFSFKRVFERSLSQYYCIVLMLIDKKCIMHHECIVLLL